MVSSPGVEKNLFNTACGKHELSIAVERAENKCSLNGQVIRMFSARREFQERYHCSISHDNKGAAVAYGAHTLYLFTFQYINI